MSATADLLRAALDQLIATCPPDERALAEREAAMFAAAVAEHAPGAEPEWREVFGATGLTFAAASAGRGWLRAPTPHVRTLATTDGARASAYAQALGDIASAACSLGEPSLEAIMAASVAAAAQLRAAGVDAPQLTADRLLDEAFDAHAPAAPRTSATTAATNATQPGSSAPAAQPHAVAPGDPTPHASPAPPERSLAELLAELDTLTGLDAVKAKVRRQADTLRVNKLRAAKGMRTLKAAQHLVFVGNPGTGKTTVARLIAGIYHALGLLSKGHLVESDRAALVAGYEGQTAIKTDKVTREALGGVLLIDEAYALRRSDSDDFGLEAIDTLVKLMEDFRDDLAVIVDGYPDEMVTFIASNPGFASRFPLTIEFPDYTDAELVAIFRRLVADNDYEADDSVIAVLRDRLNAAPRDRTFGNARFVRNVFEAAAESLSSRLSHVADPTDEQLRTIVADDLVVPDFSATDPADPAATGPAATGPAVTDGAGPTGIAPADAAPAASA